MRSKILYSTLFGGLVFGLFFSTVFLRNSVFGQKSAGGEQLLTRTVKTAPVAGVEKNEAAIRFAPAAAENKRLQSSLRWAFGGKQQTGWYLYSELIAHTIGTESPADSPEFAAALAKWQKSSSLPANGVLNETTLSAFIKYWQSRRLGRSSYPTDDQLLAAPISEFFDPTRSPDLLKLERETYAAYKRMIAAAAVDLKDTLKFTAKGELADDEKFLRIISAFRSREYQAKLRQQEPGAGRAALAVNSPHFTGHALDIYVGGKPVTTKDENRSIQVQTPAYKWLVRNAHKFGFYPYFYEPWHWEYVPARQTPAAAR